MSDVISTIKGMADGQSAEPTTELEDALAEAGLTTHQSDGRLVLSEPLELLDTDLIRRSIPGDILSRVEAHWSIDSTNTYLMDRTSSADFHGWLCLAERQVQGRGRRGRQWISPFGKNIYMSLGWNLPSRIGLEGLSLVVGMQLARTLRSAGLKDIGVKWPNDVMLDRGKLAGILIEMATPRQGLIGVVIGIGINLQLDEKDAGEIDQAWSDTRGALGIARNKLVANLVSDLLEELPRFADTGFAPYQDSWKKFDLYYGREVRIQLGENFIEGVNQGVDSRGNLLLETEEGQQIFNAGEVSLRALS